MRVSEEGLNEARGKIAKDLFRRSEWFDDKLVEAGSSLRRQPFEAYDEQEQGPCLRRCRGRFLGILDFCIPPILPTECVRFP